MEVKRDFKKFEQGKYLEQETFFSVKHIDVCTMNTRIRGYNLHVP